MQRVTARRIRKQDRSLLRRSVQTALSSTYRNCICGRSTLPRFTTLQCRGLGQSRCLVFGEPFARQGGIFHTVKPEREEVRPEPAPRGEPPAIGKVPDQWRAHATSISFSLTVPIVELRDLLLPDRPAKQGQIRHCDCSAGKTEERRIEKLPLRPGALANPADPKEKEALPGQAA